MLKSARRLSLRNFSVEATYFIPIKEINWQNSCKHNMNP